MQKRCKKRNTIIKHNIVFAHQVYHVPRAYVFITHREVLPHVRTLKRRRFLYCLGRFVFILYLQEPVILYQIPCATICLWDVLAMFLPSELTGGTNPPEPWGIINSVKGDQYAVMVKAIAHNFQWFDVLRQVALLCSTYSARMQLAKFIRQRTQGD